MTVATTVSLAGLFIAVAFGVPFPEDVALCSAGLLAAAGTLPTPAVFLVAWSAIIVGDSTQFWIGRLLGGRIFTLKWLPCAVTAERQAGIEARLQRWGPLACFSVRFLPGARIPGYLLAGASGVPPFRFLGLNCLAAAISVSFWLSCARMVPAPARVICAWVTDRRWGASAAAAAAIAWFIWWRVKRSRSLERQISGIGAPEAGQPRSIKP